MDGIPTQGGDVGLEQDLGGGFRLAALADELDRAVQVGFAVREPLCERKRKARLDEDVEPPARDFFALVLVVFDDLGHVRHWAEIRPRWVKPCPERVST